MSDEANMTIDEARALVSDAALWPRVRDFLWDFAPQVHPSWLEGLPPQVPGLMPSPRVKRFVLDSLGVAPCFHAFPKDDWSRLLLLDGDTLGSIAKWLGALACADGLRRVTDGASVRALKAALPGVYPDVFGYTMYFKGIDLAAKNAMAATGRMGEDVAATGLSVVLSLLDPLPAPLVARLRLKLPKGEWPEGRETSDAGRERLAAALAKLLKLKFPEAYTLCC